MCRAVSVTRLFEQALPLQSREGLLTDSYLVSICFAPLSSTSGWLRAPRGVIRALALLQALDGIEDTETALAC
jgi:hypothetical protein